MNSFRGGSACEQLTLTPDWWKIVGWYLLPGIEALNKCSSGVLYTEALRNGFLRGVYTLQNIKSQMEGIAHSEQGAVTHWLTSILKTLLTEAEGSWAYSRLSQPWRRYIGFYCAAKFRRAGLRNSDTRRWPPIAETYYIMHCIQIQVVIPQNPTYHKVFQASHVKYVPILILQQLVVVVVLFSMVVYVHNHVIQSTTTTRKCPRSVATNLFLSPVSHILRDRAASLHSLSASHHSGEYPRFSPY